MSYLSRVLGVSPQMTEIPQRSLFEQAVSKPVPLATDPLLLSFLNRSPVQQSSFQSPSVVRAAPTLEMRAHSADVPDWVPPKVVKLQELPPSNFWRSYKDAITKGGPLVWQDVKSTLSSFMSTASYRDVWSARFDQRLENLPGVGARPSKNNEAVIRTSHMDQE